MITIMPAADPAGAPGPIAWLTFLLVILLPLHLIPMNVALGGGFLAAWASRRARLGSDTERQRCRALLASFTSALLVVTAATITFGVAPLLFLQVLYGPLFYTSSVLMAWFWLAVIALLLAGYYSYYAFAFRRPNGTQHAGLALIGALLLVGVAFIFVNNMTLMLRPMRWAEMYAASAHGLQLNTSDPTLAPRLMHFLTASVAVTGLFVALLSRRRADDIGRWMRGLGARLFTGATYAQLLVGTAFLLTLAPRVRASFLGDGLGETGVLWASVALALLATLAVWRRPALAAGLTVAAIFGMSFVRHRVREALIADYFSRYDLAAAPQYLPMLLFAVLLIAGIGTVAWMAVRFTQAKPARQ